ncbi:SAM-dependent methyltransferase [Pseudarthrobacter sp. H3Y2-7]|uniref:SAM-dependent methyltransferase n=1 Tax=Pseudarthrobacter naphthalenicus TaxID=3031328 RepID=UPI0023B05756|nr:SAM-dependent methyltransferase [Pseudarthrobacter sp. H3Y2-7]MDE8669898.1 SAM-dependent methyltransferase [Pseudarthrobacter sp. H3Y2-7]
MTEFEDQGLPLTALAVAAGRAVETSRPGGLVADPFALALVEAARSHVDFPTAWPAAPSTASPLQQPLLLASIYIAVRTRFIDDFLRSDSQPPTPQTVILGAGLDTRAYRLPWPMGSRVFEIDHANVLEFKAGVLGRLAVRPAPELVTVATDLALPWREPLVAAGFDPLQPTTWVLEGLLPYLDAAAQLSVLKEVAALSAPGSRAVIERAVPLPKTDDVEAKLRDFSLQTGLSMTELLARADPPDPLELLTAAGWRCTGHTVQELCATYNRPLSLAVPTQSPPPQAPSGQSRGGFVTALR